MDFRKLYEKFDVHRFPIKGQVSHIYDRISVSDCQYGYNASKIIADGVNVVINVSEQPTPDDVVAQLRKADVVYRYIEVDHDQPSTDLTDAMLEALGVVAAYDGNVVFHCAAGCSRSVAVVLFLLCKMYLMPFEEAIELLIRQRPCVSPSPTYLEQAYKLLRECSDYICQCVAIPMEEPVERSVMLIVNMVDVFASKYDPKDVSVSDTRSESGNSFIYATIASKLIPLLRNDANIQAYRLSSRLRML